MARERPYVPIVVLTPLMGTARRLVLTWGAHCELTEEHHRFKQAVVSAARAVRNAGFGDENDLIVVTAGVPFNKPGTTNILRVAPCEERLIFAADPD